MKIVVGQKILNLEELYNISCYKTTPNEVVVDSAIYSEIGKTIGKEAPAVNDYPKDHDFLGIVTQNRENLRAVLAVKLIQLLKLKSQAQQSTVDLVVRILNEGLAES